MVNAFKDIEDEQDAQNIELSDNIAEDFVEYFRGNVVGHEEEGLLMYLGLLTGWAFDENCHVNTLGMGAPGSGKSLTKNTVETLYGDRDTYTKTSASGNAILDSVEWDLALVAPMDEYDKIDRPIVEVLKSSNPEDGGYAKDRNVEDPDARGGYSPTEVSADANPWVLLYAPSSKKGGIDDELEDRALVLYFSNDKNTRRGIGRKEFGHDEIDATGYDDEYIYDVHELAARLRKHVRNLPVQKQYEEDDEGDQYLASRKGDTLVYTPRWVWYAAEPIFNIDEDYTNRVYGIINNLMRASALLNHDRRNTRDVDVYLDDDSSETKSRQAVVVGPQDVANILSCLPTLLSTTHQLTPLKRHILDAVESTEVMTDTGGTTVQNVHDWLDDNDIPHPSEQTLRERMKELDEDYYLQRWEASAGKNGKADSYEIRDEGTLQPPNIYNLQQHADRDNITLAAEDCVEINPEQPFEDSHDPIRDQSFEDTVSDFREQFSGETVEDDSKSKTKAHEFMGPTDESDGGEADTEDAEGGGNDGGQGSLDEFGDDDAEQDEEGTDDTENTSVELDPDGEPETPTEAWLLDAMQDANGEPFGTQHDVTHFIGAVGFEQSSAEVDMSDTAVDPDHSIWQNRPDLVDDRVVRESDALRELNDAYSSLKQKGLVVEDEEGGPKKMFQLQVANLS